MSKTSLLCLTAGLALLPGLWAGAAETGTAPPKPVVAAPSLQSLIAEALERSAELAALQNRIAAAEASVTPARARPDPMAGAGLVSIPVNAGLRLDQDSMSGLELMVSQELTRSAKRRLRGEAQEGEAEALRARYESTRNNIVRQVRQVYYDLQYLDEAVTITEQNRQLAADILAVAESLYATGKVMQQDVFQSQVQLSRLIDSLLSLRWQREAAVTRLNRLRYHPPVESIPALAPLASSEMSLQTREAMGTLRESNARLRELSARSRQSETQVSLARANRRPDFTVSARYMIRQQVDQDPMTGTDMWSAGVAINLPWLNRPRYDGLVAAAEADRRAAEAEVQAQLNAIPARIEELLAEIRRSEDQLSLVETGLLPQAEGAVASSRAAYSTGRGDILNVLANQMNFYNLQLERLLLLRERERNLAELDYEVSGSLPGTEMGAAPSAAMGPVAGGMQPSLTSPRGGAM